MKQVAPFEISVAAYPEVHPDAASADADLDNLKRKLDAGADRAMTQFFFSPELLALPRPRRGGGDPAEIVPGILPITNFAQTRQFAALRRAMPAWMERVFDGLEQRPTRQLVAATVAAELCPRL